MDETQLFSLDEIDKRMVSKNLQEAYDALKEKGYNPTSQIVGYLMSGDVGYITSYKKARKKINDLNRALILSELVKKYLEVTK